jgi:hypothetical protein
MRWNNDTARVKIHELLGPAHRMEPDPTAGGMLHDMSRPLLSPEADAEKFAATLAGSSSDTVITQGRAHANDIYDSLMPQGWVLG